MKLSDIEPTIDELKGSIDELTSSFAQLKNVTKQLVDRLLMVEGENFALLMTLKTAVAVMEDSQKDLIRDKLGVNFGHPGLGGNSLISPTTSNAARRILSEVIDALDA